MNVASNAFVWRCFSVFMVTCLCSSLMGAEEPQPRKKDSAVRFQPKHATFTTETSLREVSPGATFAYLVTAHLDDPWHIYDYNKTPLDGGPSSTSFDFFALRGLELVGDWKADREPVKKHELAFPKIDTVSYFMDTVTWSIEVKVPAGAQGGKLTLRNQINFEICSNSSCWPATRVTLPDVTVTVKSRSSK
jgi:hypothetical protein